MSAARTTTTTATGMALIPPAVFALAAVGQRLLARRKNRAARRAESGPDRMSAAHGRQTEPERRCCGGRRRGGGRRLLSVGVGVASIGWLVAGAGELAEADTTLDARTPSAASALVTTGVFARTRNPLYVGLTGLLVAHALWLGSRRALVPAGAFVLAIDRLQIPAEEAALTEKFGKAYRAYTEQVPRWLLP